MPFSQSTELGDECSPDRKRPEAKKVKSKSSETKRPDTNSSDITSGDKTFRETKRPERQNRRTKSSVGTTRRSGQNIWREKMSGDKTSFGAIFNMHIKKYKNNTDQTSS